MCTNYDHFIDTVMKIAKDSAQLAMEYIDDAEKKHVFGADTIHLARANVYHVNYDFESKAEELQWIMDSSKVDKSSKLYLKALHELSLSSIQAGNIALAVEACTKGDSIATAMNDNATRADFLSLMGQVVIFSDRDKGRQFVREALDLLEADADSVDYDSYIEYSVMYMSYCSLDSLHDECIKEGEHLLTIFDEMGAEWLDKFDKTNQARNSAYSLLCISYGCKGKMFEASTAYCNALKYEPINSETNLAPVKCSCLLAMKRYNDAIVEYHNAADAILARGDSLNFEYANTIEGIMKCYEQAGDIVNAHAYMKRFCALQKKIYMKNQKNRSDYYERMIKTHERNMALQESQESAKFVGMLATCMGVLLAIAVGAIFIFIRYNRKLDEKNKILALKVNETLDQHIGDDKKESAKSASSSASSGNGDDVDAGEGSASVSQATIDNVQLFIRELKGRELYRNPDFKRDDLLTELYICKRTFSHDFELVMGVSFIKYLSILRVEYAAENIRRYPNYTIEAIAMESGIASRASFYRLFSDYFGISPTEYRRQCISISGE